MVRQEWFLCDVGPKSSGVPQAGHCCHAIAIVRYLVRKLLYLGYREWKRIFLTFQQLGAESPRSTRHQQVATSCGAISSDSHSCAYHYSIAFPDTDTDGDIHSAETLVQGWAQRNYRGIRTMDKHLPLEKSNIQAGDPHRFLCRYLCQVLL